MVVENARALRRRKRRKDSRYLELSELFLERVAAGETVKSVCRDPEMAPYPMVQRWMRYEPDFAARFMAAREAGGVGRKTGRPSGYDVVICEAICERLIEGESLLRMCEEPGMPSRETVFRWLRRHAEFRETYALAREIQGHLAFDAVTEAIDDATPETAYLAKVRIDGLRWQAARLAPRAFGDLKERTPVEDGAGGKSFTVLLQSFDRQGREVHTELTDEVRAEREARGAAFRARYSVEKAAILASGEPGGDSLASARAAAAVKAEWEAAAW